MLQGRVEVQIPKTKFQANFNPQNPNGSVLLVLKIEYWSSELVWMLELGICGRLHLAPRACNVRLFSPVIYH
jgi:hypothetical protein